MAVPDGERSRAETGTGTREVMAEVAPEPRELGCPEGGLGWQGRAQDPASGACSPVGNPAAGFTRHYRCSKVPPQSWERGEASTSPALVEGRKQLMPHQFVGQSTKASGWRLGKASWLSLVPSCPVLLSVGAKTPRGLAGVSQHPSHHSYFQPLSLCFPAPSPLSGKRPLIASSRSPERASPMEKLRADVLPYRPL